jgi:hypothetical protein
MAHYEDALPKLRHTIVGSVYHLMVEGIVSAELTIDGID